MATSEEHGTYTGLNIDGSYVVDDIALTITVEQLHVNDLNKLPRVHEGCYYEHIRINGLLATNDYIRRAPAIAIKVRNLLQKKYGKFKDSEIVDITEIYAHRTNSSLYFTIHMYMELDSTHLYYHG